MAESLKLTILSPMRRVLDRVEVHSVTLSGSEGQIQILPGHAPMIGILETGIFAYEKNIGGGDSGFISTGFFEVREDEVSVMADTIELKKEIDVDRAHRSQEKAESVLKDTTLDELALKKFQLKLQRALSRQQVAGSDHR